MVDEAKDARAQYVQQTQDALDALQAQRIERGEYNHRVLLAWEDYQASDGYRGEMVEPAAIGIARAETAGGHDWTGPEILIPISPRHARATCTKCGLVCDGGRLASNPCAPFTPDTHHQFQTLIDYGKQLISDPSFAQSWDAVMVDGGWLSKAFIAQAAKLRLRCKRCSKPCQTGQIFCGAGCCARWEAGDRPDPATTAGARDEASIRADERNRCLVAVTRVLTDQMRELPAFYSGRRALARAQENVDDTLRRPEQPGDAAPIADDRVRRLEEAVTDLQRSRPLACYDCGRRYDKGPDLHVSDEEWAKIAPHDGNGVLCPNCMHDRFVALGMPPGSVRASFKSGPFFDAWSAAHADHAEADPAGDQHGVAFERAVPPTEQATAAAQGLIADHGAHGAICALAAALRLLGGRKWAYAADGVEMVTGYAPYRRNDWRVPR